MSDNPIPNPHWLKNPPPEGEEAQWLKERSQNNRRAKFRSLRRRG
jgi:hypothetical protein